MKNLIKRMTMWISFILILSTACQDFLKEEVYTQYDPEAYLQTVEGINSILVAAYDNLHTRRNTRDNLSMNEFTGDIMWIWGGSYEAIAVPYMTFTWDNQAHGLSSMWMTHYQSIRYANSLVDNIDKVTSLPENKVKEYKAEARFIRGADYYYLWDMFGAVPLITSSTELNLEPSKASEEELFDFIETELKAAAEDLPLQQSLYGKATKGAALAMLGEFYLNTHQWQKAAEASKAVMDLDQYELFDGDLKNMFAVENEQNKEVIFTSPALAEFHGTEYMAYTFPPKYPVLPNWGNVAAQYCVRNDWVSTYHPDDKRLQWFLFTYTDTGGQVHDLMNPADIARAVRCFKWVPDVNAIGNRHGNDWPIIRYALVLLNRSEALNELNGPTQEAVDLLNEIRQRAGAPLFNLSDFPTKESLRDALLQERGWEFVAEGRRRIDLVRQGKFISSAIARGATNAKDYMVKFPIPLNEMNANPNLVQNDGY